MKNLICCLLFFSPFLIAQERNPITFEDLWAMQRIDTYEVSTDERLVVFDAKSYDIGLNEGNSDIFIVNSDGTDMKVVKGTDKNESEPKFVPGGDRISYTSGGQVWSCNFDGTDDKQITDISTGASGYSWSDDGNRILFVSSVYPDCMDDDCNKRRDEAKVNNKVKASIFTGLMYRHWDEWRGDKRSHLFIYDLKNDRYTDLTLNSKYDVPPIALGSSNDYSFSPDFESVAFTMNLSNFLAASTDNDVFELNITGLLEGKENSVIKFSVSKGNDTQPVYSPDGSMIAYTSMERTGFEADKKALMKYNRETGELKNLTKEIDLSIEEILWSPDSKFIYFTATKEIYTPIYRIDITTKEVQLILKEHINSSLSISTDGKTIYFKQQRTDLPYEIFAVDSDGKNLLQITSINKNILGRIEFSPLETFVCEGAEGAMVQSILVKPPFFDPDKKYPMIFLIHGGPQGNWDDNFHYRWNLQMFAAPGYVVVAPNPRGSTGYGQKFTDEISRDWGGKVYTDLINSYDYAVENYSFIDSENTFAAGASYGGYMVNWIECKTDRFNALFSHNGVFNTESFYGTTEELWFPEWEFGGPPWVNRELYAKWSPHNYIQNAKTPMLIVHSANDFRIGEEQAFQLFTSLQRLGVESKFLYFPDETHFVTKPQNARLWWGTVFNWFEQYKK